MSSNLKFVVTRKKDGKVLAKGTYDQVAKILGVSKSSLMEHYYDRDNKNRFWNCPWRIDKDGD